MLPNDPRLYKPNPGSMMRKPQSFGNRIPPGIQQRIMGGGGGMPGQMPGQMPRQMPGGRPGPGMPQQPNMQGGGGINQQQIGEMMQMINKFKQADESGGQPQGSAPMPEMQPQAKPYFPEALNYNEGQGMPQSPDLIAGQQDDQGIMAMLQGLSLR